MSDPNMDAADLLCEIQSRTFDDFSDWQKYQSDWTLKMGITQQASSYADDKLWHDRTDVETYVFQSVGLD